MQLYNRLKEKCPETSMEFLGFVTHFMKWNNYEELSGSEKLYIASEFYGYSLIHDEIENDEFEKKFFDYASTYEKSTIFVRENQIDISKNIPDYPNEVLFEMFENRMVMNTPYTGFIETITKSNLKSYNRLSCFFDAIITDQKKKDKLHFENFDFFTPIADVPF